jgi:hypothetical protein
MGRQSAFQKLVYEEMQLWPEVLQCMWCLLCLHRGSFASTGVGEVKQILMLVVIPVRFWTCHTTSWRAPCPHVFWNPCMNCMCLATA